MGTDWRKVILSDERRFLFGEIYEVKDELVNFPEGEFTPRNFHSVRYVVITQHCNSNLNKHIWTLNAAPLSSKIEYKRDTDLEITPAEGNYINRKSLIRLGSSQPFLKVDLSGPVGKLTEMQMKQLAALQLKLTGL